MKVARITRIDGREFMTSDISAESLGKLNGVERIEIVEMKAEEFYQIPATDASEQFFAPLKVEADGH